MVYGHAFLVGNQVEGAGYGLYSYLLFWAPPRDGPYIISTLNPLGSCEPFPQRYLLQDLSLVPYDHPALIYAWVQEFLERASQPHRWEEMSAKQFAMKLRQAITIVATDVPEIRNALESRITWVDMAGVR